MQTYPRWKKPSTVFWCHPLFLLVKATILQTTINFSSPATLCLHKATFETLKEFLKKFIVILRSHLRLHLDSELQNPNTKSRRKSHPRTCSFLLYLRFYKQCGDLSEIGYQIFESHSLYIRTSALIYFWKPWCYISLRTTLIVMVHLVPFKP